MCLSHNLSQLVNQSLAVLVHLAIGNNGDYSLTSGTISAWIRTNDAGTNFRGIIVREGIYGLYLKDNVLITYDWTKQSDPNPNAAISSTNLNLADGQFHHVALTFDDDTGRDTLIYIDGSLAKTIPSWRAGSANKKLVIGTGSENGLNFAGVISEAQVFSSYLSADTIRDYVNNSVPTNAPGLAGYWPLNEGSGSVATDLSPFGRAGTIFNGTWTPGASYPRIHGEFHATELASVTNLDASNRRITDLTKLEHLTNLLSLDLSHNQLQNSDFAMLVPPRLTSGAQAGELVGLSHLRELNLDVNTALTDISGLAVLKELRSLKLEGTGVSASANNTTSTLLSLPDLEFLTMPNRFLQPGQNLVFDEGDQVNLLLADPDSTVPWQVFMPWNSFETPIASGTGAVQFDTTDSGLATLRIGTVFPLDIEDIQLYVRNVAPTIESVPDLTGIREGQTISIAPNVGGNFDVLIDGSSVGRIVVTDPSSADLANLQARFSLIDRNGGITELRDTSLHLDGTNFAQVANSADLDISRTITMETWLKVDSFDTTWQPIFYKGSGVTPNNATYSLSVSDTGLLRLTSADETGEENAETAPGTIQLGQWYHVAAVVDRVTGDLKIYVDGEFEGPGSVRTGDAKSNDAPLLIGQTFDNNSEGPSGDYIYRTTFDLPNNVDLSSVVIEGRWATDNNGVDIQINDSSVGGGQLSGAFDAWTSFRIDSGFVAGTNTLEFVLNNSAAGPTGLRVDDLTGSFSLTQNLLWTNDIPDPLKLEDNAVYDLRITVYDDDGGSDTSTSLLTVSNVDPTTAGTIGDVLGRITALARSALAFDGLDTVLTPLNIDPSATGGATFDVWVYPTGTSTAARDRLGRSSSPTSRQPSRRVCPLTQPATKAAS